ncbi:MAG: DUF1580 domain-containing protein, partial [Phycisphaerales bacterium]|nr:DUF1580 domain-containing protein [Phycisphaerales bacterium]
MIDQTEGALNESVQFKTGGIEELITLVEAAKLSPGRPSVNAVWRWCRRGVRARNGERIRLEHVRAGGRIFTSAAGLGRF